MVHELTHFFKYKSQYIGSKGERQAAARTDSDKVGGWTEVPARIGLAIDRTLKEQLSGRRYLHKPYTQVVAGSTRVNDEVVWAVATFAPGDRPQVWADTWESMVDELREKLSEHAEQGVWFNASHSKQHHLFLMGASAGSLSLRCFITLSEHKDGHDRDRESDDESYRPSRDTDEGEEGDDASMYDADDE